MRYLLGKLSESEVALLEQQYFSDDAMFDDIEIAEDELIDAYVRDRLSAADRKQFETKLLSSKRIAERVQFARLLSKSAFSLPIDDEPARTSWWRRLFDFSLVPNPAISGAVAGVVLLIVFGIPGSLVWMRLRNESTRLDIERAAIEQQKQQLAQESADRQSKTNQLAADLQNSKENQDKLQQQVQTLEEKIAQTNPQVKVSPIPVAFLIPGASRAPGQIVELVVPPTASIVRLKLALDADDYNSYRATIWTPSNPNVLTRAGLRTRRSGRDRIIVLQFSSRLLSSGQYHVGLSGLKPTGTYDPVADYSVLVSRK